MIVRSIKTPLITPQSCQLLDLLGQVLPEMPDKSILAITSKVVSLCEGRTVPIQGTDKEKLIRDEADYYMPEVDNRYNIHFTIAHDTLIASSGIDESNVGGVYALWPSNPQATANAVRQWLEQKFGGNQYGVIITDSTCRPMRMGTSGITLAFSGFKPLRSYIGQEDLFGRKFKVTRADIAEGLAAAAVLVMGEGTECTPLAVIEDLSGVEFTGRDPNPEELASIHIDIDDDLFAPFLKSVTWLLGGRRRNQSK